MEQHGYRNTPTYTSWIEMRRRCRAKNRKEFSQYGGRGISVCDEWNSSFLAFLRDMGERPENTTLDRIDVNGSYCKSNCRWATTKEQGFNTTYNTLITYKNQTKCLAEWAEEYEIKPVTLARRFKKGWSLDRIFNERVHQGRTGQIRNQRLITYNGMTKNIKEWAKYYNIKHATLHKRITKYNMSFEEAVNRG